MRLTPIALLVLAALPGAPGPASTRPVPPDVTIRTRTTFTGNPEISHSALLQVKGARQRLVRSWQGPSARHVGPAAVITQCDVRRLVFVNDAKRLYGLSPISDGSTMHAVAVARHSADTRPVVETVTIDAVDTGERRTFGTLVARRVVTTTTADRQGTVVTTRVQDGWYIRPPSEHCGDGSSSTRSTMLAAGSSVGRTEFKWKGTARTGWPVIETDRSSDTYGTFVSTTSLVEFSQAPLDPALFDVPHGYRAALPLGHGGFDLEKPDTVVNRVRHAVETAASWVHYTWSRIGSRSHTETIARQR
jgi:hypothetical protein